MTKSMQPPTLSIDDLIARCVAFHRQMHDQLWPLARREPILQSREYAAIADHVGGIIHEAKVIAAAANPWGMPVDPELLYEFFEWIEGVSSGGSFDRFVETLMRQTFTRPLGIFLLVEQVSAIELRARWESAVAELGLESPERLFPGKVRTPSDPVQVVSAIDQLLERGARYDALPPLEPVPAEDCYPWSVEWREQARRKMWRVEMESLLHTCHIAATAWGVQHAELLEAHEVHFNCFTPVRNRFLPVLVARAKLEVAKARALTLPLEGGEDGEQQSEAVPPALDAAGLGTRVEPLKVTLRASSREAYFGGTRIAINGHSDFRVLQVLVGANGAVVPYEELLLAIKPGDVDPHVKLTEAPQDLKDVVSRVRAKLVELGAPRTVIGAMRGQGYILPSFYLTPPSDGTST